jgi:Rrf2 family transcriptional regulator, nitric oxide-sensitive transcriptional repressor
MNAPNAFTTQQIAAGTRVPPAYLAKVLQSLVKAGIVHSQRGTGGGFDLSRTPQEMTILEVLNAVDPIARIKTCPLGLDAHGTNLCALHRRLDEAVAVIEKGFQDTSVGDLLSHPTKSTPLCNFSSQSAAASQGTPAPDTTPAADELPRLADMHKPKR